MHGVQKRFSLQVHRPVVSRLLTSISADRVHSRLLVSKNVCHDVVYDASFHELVQQHMGDSLGNAYYCGRMAHNGIAGLTCIYEALVGYIRRKAAKALHDPLAACVAIDPSICTFAQGTSYFNRLPSHIILSAPQDGQR